jgi:hypothetical protein
MIISGGLTLNGFEAFCGAFFGFLVFCGGWLMTFLLLKKNKKNDHFRFSIFTGE